MAAEDWLPTLEQVSDLVRARTRDDLGTEVGVFDENTRPTAESVTRLIAAEAPIVLVRTGDPAALECPDAPTVRTAVANVIAKRVAAIIEASYRPDEVADGRTVADFYQGSMKDDLEAIEKAAATCRAWQPGDPSSGGDSGPSARWAFPPAEPMPRGL